MARLFSLTHQELATVLAALRLMQNADAEQIAGMFHFDDCEPLDDNAIDDLCERINVECPLDDEDEEGEEDDDAVRQTCCANCDLDIEGFAPYTAGEWRDRGNNTHCPSGDMVHRPR